MICVLDVEATCVEKAVDKVNFISEIIEIGAVFIDKNYNVISEFDSFIQPSLNTELTQFCKTLTSIKQSDVDTAKPFRNVFFEFESWFNQYSSDLKFASFGYYDFIQMQHDCKLHSIPFPFINHINIKPLVEHKTGLRRIGLGKVLRHLNIPFEGTRHRGIDDSKNIVKVCKALNLFDGL